jgi:imidazolonepropionase
MGFILRNISTLLTLEQAAFKQGRHIQEADLGITSKSAIVVEANCISWVGPNSKIPKEYTRKNLKEYDCKGLTVLPGFVECHTHLIYAGHRADEFELKNQGMTYQEVAARGGGILSTMKRTRSASQADLTASGQKRVDHFVSQGVTTLEAKSGYALNLKDELKCLKAIQNLKGPRTVSTFLGAHALPPEFKTYEEYLQHLAEKVLPEIKKKNLASRVDVFIEKGFFPKEASLKYLQIAKKLGFETVVHADQLTLSGGTDVAVEMGSLSGDHLLQIKDAEINKLGKSGVTCVMLPAADLYMRCPYPPAKKLIDAGARVALATDFNPGTSPTQDLNLVGLLARLEMKMTLPQVIAAYTVGAAFALKLQTEVGSLRVGKSADFMCIEDGWDELFYSIGAPAKRAVFSRGKKIFGKL